MAQGVSFTRRLYLGTGLTDPAIYTGSADPNGSVSGNAGDLYLRSSGTITTYICQGGTSWSASGGGSTGLATFSIPPGGGTDANTPNISTITTNWNTSGLLVNPLGNTTMLCRRRVWSLSGATTVTGGMYLTTTVGSAVLVRHVIGLRESATSKMVNISIGGSGSFICAFGERDNSDTSFAAFVGTPNSGVVAGSIYQPYFYRLVIAGGNVDLYCTRDGSNWPSQPNIGSVAVSTGFTVAPDQYLIGCIPETTATTTNFGAVWFSLLAA